MIIKSISTEMNKDIFTLGEMIADEVRHHIKGSQNRYTRVNFIAFSLGGVLARAAVDNLH